MAVLTLLFTVVLSALRLVMGLIGVAAEALVVEPAPEPDVEDAPATAPPPPAVPPALANVPQQAPQAANVHAVSSVEA